MPRTLKELLASNPSPSDAEIHEWITTATDDDLKAFLPMFVHNKRLYTHAKTILEDRRHRELKQPHWTLTPGFIIAFLAIVFAAIAAWPVIRDWLPKPEPAHKASSFQSPQSNSAPGILATNRTSKPASVP